MEYHIHIWQVSLLLSCGSTLQIWMWSIAFSFYFCTGKICTNRKTNEQSFSNPHPWPGQDTEPSLLGWTQRMSSALVITGSNNGLLPNLSMEPLSQSVMTYKLHWITKTNFSEISIQMIFSCKKPSLKTRSLSIMQICSSQKKKSWNFHKTTFVVKNEKTSFSSYWLAVCQMSR